MGYKWVRGAVCQPQGGELTTLNHAADARMRPGFLANFHL
jgi:hypothetical protein